MNPQNPAPCADSAPIVVNRPDAAALPTVPVEVPPPAAMAGLLNEANDYLRCYRFGECTVIITKEWGEWHLSVAHPRRYPTWDEIAGARYALLPDGCTMAMVLPPRADYVNLHRNCFQLVEVPAIPESGPYARPIPEED